MVAQYLLYLISFAVGTVALFESFWRGRTQGYPLVRFLSWVFAGLTLEMGVTLVLNFALAAGIPPVGGVLFLLPLALAVFGMSLLLGLATLGYFKIGNWMGGFLCCLHAAAFGCLGLTSRVDETQRLLEPGWGGYGLFLLPISVLVSLVLFAAHLFFQRSSLGAEAKKALLGFLVLGALFLPFFTASVGRVALAKQVPLIPDFFPMTPLAIFYLAASVLLLWLLVRRRWKSVPFPLSLPSLQFWGADFGISPREAEVLFLLLQGKGNKQIAFDLGITTATVKAHLTRLFQKTRTQSRFELVRSVEGQNSTKVE